MIFRKTKPAQILAFFILALAVCGFGPWTSELGRQNPLVGKIYHDGRLVVKTVLLNDLIGARFVLLGEVHNNPDHHKIQADLLAAMVKTGRRPGIVLEMLPRSEQSRIDAYIAGQTHPAKAAQGFGAAFNWQKRGWPDWIIYQPILNVALKAGLKVFAGNIDREMTRKLAKQGYSALSDGANAVEWQNWGLGTPLSQPLQTRLHKILQQSHCEMLPEQALPAMGKVQRARDASLADAMLAANTASGDGAVLIAGAGHVRSDFAVPYYLNKRGQRGQWVSVNITPVDNETSDPASLTRPQEPASDSLFTVFTPRIDDIDHCAELKKQFSKKKKPATE